MSELVITYTRHAKRPAEATPERAAYLYSTGVKPKEMAKVWGVSVALVYYLLHRAGIKTPKNNQQPKAG